MREIDFDKLESKDLIDHAAISDIFKQYLMLVLGYDEGEADFVIASDFEDPYDTPFLTQDYEGVFDVDGKNMRLDFAEQTSVRWGYFIWHMSRLSNSICLLNLIHLITRPRGLIVRHTVRARRKSPIRVQLNQPISAQ